ncbi:MAG: RNA polymerase sigma factor [Fimbriiglobus sp.]|nr:RNA polymerase sigma factor [Fimbriiglobus sp.]
MTRPEPSDEVLVRRIARGDPDALNLLFRRHRGVAFRVAYRLLGNEADALDAVQDGFVNALTHLDRFGGRSSFKTWLLKIVCNAALDLGRSRRRRDVRFGGPSADDLPTVPDFRENEPDQGLWRADLRELLVAALAELPEPQRQAFVLHVEGGLTYQEVAESLGIAVGTVMSRLFYARQRLRESLAPRVTP